MKLSIIFILSLLGAISALAAQPDMPLEHVSCDKHIVEPEGSQGYWYNNDCSVAYVLPPSSGKLKMSELSFNEDKTTCDAITGAVDALAMEQNSLLAKVAQAAKLSRQITQDTSACAPIVNRAKVFEDRATKLNKDLADAKSKLDSQKKLKVQCKSNSNLDGCDDVDGNISDFQDQVSELKEKIQDNAETAKDVEDRVAQCQSAHPAAKQDDTTQAQIRNLNTDISELKNKITDERKRIMGLPGASGSMIFSQNMIEMVKAFKNANAGIPHLEFRAMPLKSGVIHFEKVTNGKTAGLDSVTSFTIFGGKPATGGESSADSSFDVNGREEVERLFGTTTAGQISINLYAACRMKQRFGDLSRPDARDAVAAMIRPMAMYTFDIGASKDIKIDFNQKYLYQLIHEHSTSGGLFWTSSSDSILESTVADNWLKISISSEDSDLSWDKSEDRLFALRKEVLDSILLQHAKKSYLNPQDALADGGTPPKDGAKVAAENLHKCPNFYCQVAAVVFDVADAIMSQTSSTGSYTRTMNVSNIENLIINGTVKFNSSQTFETETE